jgi:hypothetical protein
MMSMPLNNCSFDVALQANMVTFWYPGESGPTVSLTWEGVDVPLWIAKRLHAQLTEAIKYVEEHKKEE